MKPFVDRRGVGLSFFSAETYTCIPLTIAPKLRICIGCSKRFQDRLRPSYTDSCVSHNRHPKCTTLLPLELHFLASGRLKIKHQFIIHLRLHNHCNIPVPYLCVCVDASLLKIVINVQRVTCVTNDIHVLSSQFWFGFGTIVNGNAINAAANPGRAQ